MGEPPESTPEEKPEVQVHLSYRSLIALLLFILVIAGIADPSIFPWSN